MENETANSNAPAEAAQTNPSEKHRQRRMAREPQVASNCAASADASHEAAKTPPPSRANSKIARVITLLEADGGATLDALVDATGWLPHTTRAALTGLKNKGHLIEKAKLEGVTHYSISKVAAQ